MTLVPEKALAHLTGLPLAEIRRMRRAGTIRGYGGTQPKKKRYVFDVAEVLAATKGSANPAQVAAHLDLDVRRLFERHGIDPNRALSGNP